MDRSRQSLPLAHGQTGAGEAGWPDAPVPLFPTEGPFFELDGTVVLEGLSAAANRGRRKPRAGSTWSRAPGFLGIPAPGGPRPARRRGAVEGGSRTRKGGGNILLPLTDHEPGDTRVLGVGPGSGGSRNLRY